MNFVKTKIVIVILASVLKTIHVGVVQMPTKNKKRSRVNEAKNYTKPTLRKRLFNQIKRGTKGGSAGQWSARKAQMLAAAYKRAGGGYR